MKNNLLILVIIVIIIFLHSKDNIYEYFNSDYVISSRDLRKYNVVSTYFTYTKRRQTSLHTFQYYKNI